MTRQDALVELQSIQSELIRDIVRLQSVANEIGSEDAKASLLTNYVVPYLRYHVEDDGEFSCLVPYLGDVIASANG